jgi:hypothetical protein
MTSGNQEFILISIYNIALIILIGFAIHWTDSLFPFWGLLCLTDFKPTSLEIEEQRTKQLELQLKLKENK